jgi:aspartyl protease family protein
MKALVPVVLVVGALVGWFGPSVAPPTEVVGGSVIDEAEQAQLNVAAKPEWYGGDMVLEREGDGHFYASVRVDTRDYRMLVDTGASMVALTDEDAQDIGLSWDPAGLIPVARGAGGTVMGVPMTLREIAVGDFVARNVDAVIIPEGLPISLLGQSFLSHVENVAISGDTLTLSN